MYIHRLKIVTHTYVEYINKLFFIKAFNIFRISCNYILQLYIYIIQKLLNLLQKSLCKQRIIK